MLKITVAAILAMFLAGCAHTYGTTAITDDKIVSQIKEGVSTKREVKTLLGEPNEAESADNGDVIWKYYYAVAGYGGSEQTTLTVRFDKTTDLVKFSGKGKTTGGLR